MPTTPFLNRPEVRSYGPPILFLILGIILLALVAFPNLGRIQDLNSEIATEETRITSLKEKNTKLLDLASQSNEIDKSFSSFDQAIASESKVPELLAEVQKISNACGVKVTTLQFSGEAKQQGGNVQEVHLQYAIEGSFSKLTCLVSSIENASRLIDIESLRYNTNVNQETGAATVSAQATLVSYYTNEPILSPDTPISFSFSDLSYTRNLELLNSFKVY